MQKKLISMDCLKPQDFIPEWDDKDRIAFLYSAFPSDRELNPHHYDSKLTYWKNVVLGIASADSYKYCYFKWNDLCHMLMKDNRQPLGLNVLFDDMVRTAELKTLDAYLQDLQAKETWVGWGMNYVKKPSQWVLNKVLSPLKKRNNSQEFVSVKAVELKANKLLQSIQDIFVDHNNLEEYHYSNMGIFTYSELVNISKSLTNDIKSLDIILTNLKSIGKVVVYVKESDIEQPNSTEQKFVKFAKRNENKVQPINEVNIGCIELHKSKTELENSIHKMYEKAESLKHKAKDLLKQNKKGLAANELRKKHRILEALNIKESALQNIDKLLESIGKCKTDKMIMDAYKCGVKTYNDLINTEGMSLNEVEKTKSEMSDIFDLQSDISEAISSQCQTDYDDATLESELKSIIAEDELEMALENLTISTENKTEQCDKMDLTLANLLPKPPNNNLNSSTKTIGIISKQNQMSNLKQTMPLPAS